MDQQSTPVRREVSETVVARFGHVEPGDAPTLPWVVRGALGEPIEPVSGYLPRRSSEQLVGRLRATPRLTGDHVPAQPRTNPPHEAAAPPACGRAAQPT
jgi:hypothetical protein